jgi:beta-lactamase regulating signal transducer with metallopeptidase domain
MNTLDSTAVDWAAIEWAATQWFTWAWRAGLVSLAVLALWLVLRPVAERLANAHVRSWWWLAPLVPLAVPPLPFAWPSAWPTVRVPPAPAALVARPETVASGADESRVANESEITLSTTAAVTRDVASTPRANAAPTEQPSAASPSAARLAPATWLAFVWWFTSAALFVRFLLAQRTVLRLVRRARPVSDAALAQRFAALARRAGVRRVRLLVVEGGGSPATLGVFTPRIVVPHATLSHLSTAELDWVLLHELAHVRRRDVVVEALVQLVHIVWPLHPSAWIAARHVRRERELACDEAALAHIARVGHASRRTSREAAPLALPGALAARALLSVVEQSQPRDTRPAAALHLVHPRSLERVRIMKLLHPDRPAVAGSSFLAAFFVAGLCVSIAGASAAQGGPARPANPQARRAIAVQDVLGGALDYLVAAQRSDGAWPANADGRDPRQDFSGAGELDDVGVTGVVLLALADAPESLENADRREAIRRGLAYLARHQGESGSFASIVGNSYAIPSHAYALTAFLRLNQRIDPSAGAAWRVAAQRGLDFAMAARNPYMGWRYGVQPDGDNDTVVTSWMLLALAEARNAGLAVDFNAVQEALHYVNYMTDPATGRTGYVERGVGGSRLYKKAEAFPSALVEFETATALVARQAWPDLTEQSTKHASAAGASSESVWSDPLASAVLVANKPPVWDTDKGSLDVYAWAFGARAVQPLGGALAERWNTALADALLAGVVRDEQGRASWRPIDAWHVEGQNVAMTAWCVCALEALP